MMKAHSSSLLVRVFKDGAVLEDFSLEEKGFGSREGNKLILFPEEVLYLLEKGKIVVDTNRDLRKYFSRGRPGFLRSYAVYKDLRDRGFTVKSGAKYGADFRVYDKGVSIKERVHSKYLVWVMDQDERLPLKTLVGINRIAHSVKKRLLLAIVDKDFDITYIQNTRVVL